jgi:hypothetical protein
VTFGLVTVVLSMKVVETGMVVPMGVGIRIAVVRSIVVEMIVVEELALFTGTLVLARTLDLSSVAKRPVVV